MSETHTAADVSRPLWIGLHCLALAGFAVAFYGVLFPGSQYGFEKGVEYWLFRPTGNQPLVILGLSAWFAYRRSPRLRALPRRTGPWWLVVTAFVVAAFVQAWGVYTSAFDLHVFAMMALAVGVVALYWGLAGLRVLWAPIVFLLFAIPIPAPVLLAAIWKLQIWTANGAGLILHVAGVPALVSGDQIFRATQAFQVIEGCSGLRSIETLTMLTCLLIDLFRRVRWHALLLLLLAPLVAFALNSLRVVTLILNPHSEIIAIHNLQGIAILLGGLLIIYFIDGQLERFPGLSPRRRAVRTAGDPRTANRSKSTIATLLVASAASVAIQLWLPVWKDPAPAPHTLYSTVAAALAEWSSEKNEPDFTFRGSVRFGEVFDRSYLVSDEVVEVFVATSDFNQRGGAIISRVTAVPGSGWLPRSSEIVRVEPGGRLVEQRVLEKGKRRVVLRHFYEGDRGLFVETMRSLFALDRSPLRRTRPQAVVRISTTLRDRTEAALLEAEGRLDRVHARLEPALQTVLHDDLAHD